MTKKKKCLLQNSPYRVLVQEASLNLDISQSFAQHDQYPHSLNSIYIERTAVKTT